jgi:hypothetical protein
MQQINTGYYVQLTDRSKQRIMFSASTGNFDKEDFLKLWELVGRKILEQLKNSDDNEGYQMNFEIEASKLI